MRFWWQFLLLISFARLFNSFFLIEDLNLVIPQVQYYSCWWPGDERSQGSSSWDIDLCRARPGAVFVLHIYCKISNIRCTKSPNLNVPRLVLWLSLPNPMKPGVKSRRRCSWSSAERRWSNYIWVIDNFIAYWGASYIRDLTVVSTMAANDQAPWIFSP